MALSKGFTVTAHFHNFRSLAEFVDMMKDNPEGDMITLAAEYIIDPTPNVDPVAPVDPTPLIEKKNGEIDVSGQEGVGSLDAHGVPWNSEIHSATRVVNKDGTWRRRRGVDKEVADRVENETRRPGYKPEYASPVQDDEPVQDAETESFPLPSGDPDAPSQDEFREMVAVLSRSIENGTIAKEEFTDAVAQWGFSVSEAQGSRIRFDTVKNWIDRRVQKEDDTPAALPFDPLTFGSGA